MPQQDSIGETQGWALHASWTPAEGIELRSIRSHRGPKQSQYDNGVGPKEIARLRAMYLE